MDIRYFMGFYKYFQKYKKAIEFYFLKKDVIVTGGAGFIGSNIVSALIKSGVNIHIFDNLSTGNKQNLDLNRVNFYKIDLKDDYRKWPKIFIPRSIKGKSNTKKKENLELKIKNKIKHINIKKCLAEINIFLETIIVLARQKP